MKKYRFKILASLFLIFGFAPSLFSAERSAQELILADNPIYDMATAIFLEAGLWNFADSFPVTIQEMKFHLSEIDYDSLSEQGQKYYDAIYEWISEKSFSLDSHLLSVGLEPSVSLEGYYKTNDDVYWVFDRYNRNPVVDVPLKISLSDYATIVCDLYLGQNKTVINKNDNYINIPLKANDFDLNFPTTAYFSTGTMLGENNGISFQLGMSERAIGRTLSGSIIQSEYMTGASYGQLNFYGRRVKFTTSVTQLNVDRYYYTHKIEIRPWKKLTLTGLEGCLVAKPLELRFLNPFTIFHGFAPWHDYGWFDGYNCAFLAFQAVFVPVKYVRIYGLFAQTQLQTPFEKKNYPNDLTPNGVGGQVGVETYIPFSTGHVFGGIEFYYADPYLYLKPNPSGSMVRPYQESFFNLARFYEWIGSPFGPDSIAITAKVGYEHEKIWSVWFKYLFLLQGELSDKNIFGSWGGTNLSFPVGGTWAGYPTNAEERDRKTPSGIPQYKNVFTLGASYFIINRVEIFGQASVSYILNNKHIEEKKDISFEFALGSTIKLYDF